MEYNFFACEEFWRDFKRLKNNVSDKLMVETHLGDDEFLAADVSSKIDSVPLLNAISTTVANKIDCLVDVADRNGKQPFLEEGWTIYKLRWGIDNRGKSGGLRIMFCSGSTNIILLVAIKLKKEVENEEAGFQSETILRIKQFLSSS